MPNVEVGRLRPLPALRVTDEMVRTVLTWARNYEEIAEFTLVKGATGRKWFIRLHQPLVIGAGISILLGRPAETVPIELMLTSREALAFGYGCVAGGESKPRAEKRKEWGW